MRHLVVLISAKLPTSGRFWDQLPLTFGIIERQGLGLLSFSPKHSWSWGKPTKIGHKNKASKIQNVSLIEIILPIGYFQIIIIFLKIQLIIDCVKRTMLKLDSFLYYNCKIHSFLVSGHILGPRKIHILGDHRFLILNAQSEIQILNEL